MSEPNPYAHHLGQRDPIPVLHETVREIAAIIAPLTIAQLNHTPAPGKWNLREILSHLADCEVVFGYRLRMALSIHNYIIQPFDQDIFATRYATYDAASALALFLSMREWNIALIGTATPADYARAVTHPESGPTTFRVLVERLASHTLHHIPAIKVLATT
jgi:hypothetical protein